MANRIPVKAIYSGTYGSSDVTSLGEFASGDTIDVSYIADGTITAAKLAADTATQAELDTVSTVASAALPKAGGAMTGAITTNSTFDGVDIATRDGVLTSTTTTANAALPKAGGAMTGAITTNSTFDGRDVATDGTKLDTVETNADVTDTTNVTSAGALMDSECSSLASVKAINQGLTSTSSPTFTTLNATTVDLGNWTVTESGGVLYFATSGTNKMKVDASGNLTVVGNVTAYGSV